MKQFYKLLNINIILFAMMFAHIANAKTPTLSDKQKVLIAHNHFRAKHHAPNLVWDEELANYAEKHAFNCKFKHSSSPYGENLAAGYSSITDAVQAWYVESELYSYSRPQFSHTTGHFTQVIWKSSTKLGCAFVNCNGRNGTHGNFLVCEYSPAGNVLSKEHFVTNVLPIN